MKRNEEHERMRTENVQLGEEEEKKIKKGKFKKIHDLFENNCNKADINVLLPNEIELLRADSANKNQSSKEENLASVQQGEGRREPAIGGNFHDVELSSNEKSRIMVNKPERNSSITSPFLYHDQACYTM